MHTKKSVPKKMTAVENARVDGLSLTVVAVEL